MTTIQSLSGKKICILGYGREGKAMAQSLTEFAEGSKVTIADKDDTIDVPKHFEAQIGTDWLKNLDRFDVVIKSPGIPPKELLTTHYSLLTTPTQIFFDTIKDSGATVIGVTGSKGKSTTASLIHHILSRSCDSKIAVSGLRTAATVGNVRNTNSAEVFLVGNIGEPAIAHLKDAKPNTIFVHELSSYQLMNLTSSPHIAVVTSFFKEHADYHSTRPAAAGLLMASPKEEHTPLENYLDAKKNIARFQTKNDHIYFNARNESCKSIAEESAGIKHPFSDIDAPVQIEETKLKGTHNLSNIAAAFLVCEQLGVPHDKAIEAITSFNPLPHRLQSLGVINGIEWIDDSISTTPESAIAALDALGNNVETMILGGQDRDYDFSPLIKRLQTSSVKTVILLPESGKKIGHMIREAQLAVECFDVKDMKEAVELSTQHTQSSKLKAQSFPIVLLSPAAPSYGQFKNFEERGNAFASFI